MEKNELMPPPSSEMKKTDMNIEKKKNPFSLKKEGPVTYIVNSKGEKISKGYHELKVFKQQTDHGEITAYIGKLGAMSVLLMVPESENGFFQESDEFHDLEINESLGLILAQKGAMKYILDLLTGKIISDGYHGFFKKGDMLYGRIGSREEVVNLLRQETKNAQLKKPEELDLGKINEDLKPLLSRLLGK